MKPVTIIDDDYMTVWYHIEDKILHHKFKKFTSGSHLRDNMLKAAEIFRDRGACKWLSDDRENSAIPSEDRAWGDQYWLPIVLKAGWKYWAMVLPRKIVGQMNMKRIIDAYAKLGLTTQIFSDPETAMGWLKNQS
ncbi:MAG: hypothetical protein AB1439_03375 [candidate division FCPU426 bacterium]